MAGTQKILYMPYDPAVATIALTRAEYAWKNEEFLFQEKFKAREANKARSKSTKFRAIFTSKLTVASQTRVVYYDPAATEALTWLGDGAQIYIRGHGSPGGSEIEGGHGGEEVSARTVVKRLIASGLSKFWTGDIKCYNCHSGEARKKHRAFAQRICDELAKRGYKHVRVYGYIGALDSVPSQDAQGNYHKHTYRVNDDDSLTTLGRMSDERFRIPMTPSVVKEAVKDAA